METIKTIYWLRFALGITAAVLCVGYGLVAGTISTNLVLNPSVEAGETTPNDWSLSGSAEWSTAYARTGSRSISINVTEASAEWIGKVKPIHEEYTYQISCFLKGEVRTGQFSLVIRWFSEGLRQIDEDNVAIPEGDYPTWSPIAGGFTAPKEAKSCEIALKVENGTGVVYGDDFEVRPTESLTKIMNGVSIALVTYLISYYIIKFKFMHKVEKPQKLLTTGIGVYFLAWLVFWILLYTIVAGL